MFNARAFNGFVVLIACLSCCETAFHVWPSPAWPQAIDTEHDSMSGRADVIRSADEENKDETFSREAAAKYGSREAASRVFATEGWTAMRSGKTSSALANFNRARVLNPKNYLALWGFGALLSDEGKLLEAIEQLETALEVIDDPKNTAALLRDTGVASSAYAASLPKDDELDRAQYFVKANQCFAESVERDPGYADSWRAWALSLLDQERYSEAAIKAERARQLNAEPLPAAFWQELKRKIDG